MKLLKFYADIADINQCIKNKRALEAAAKANK